MLARQRRPLRALPGRCCRSAQQPRVLPLPPLHQRRRPPGSTRRTTHHHPTRHPVRFHRRNQNRTARPVSPPAPAALRSPRRRAPSLRCAAQSRRRAGLRETRLARPGDVPLEQQRWAWRVMAVVAECATKRRRRGARHEKLRLGPNQSCFRPGGAWEEEEEGRNRRSRLRK